jgi:hypothetical protein
MKLVVWLQLLQRVAFNPGNDAGDQPARLTHRDDRDERAILVQRGDGSLQIIQLRHGALLPLLPAASV